MHATKEAILANEHYPDLKSSIFYTDVRAVGKRFQEYITRARQEYDVAYIRGRPGKITEDPETGNPIIWYDETILTEAEDPVRRATNIKVGLVVLCQALIPHSSHREIAQKLGLELDDAGFVEIPDRLVRPVDTNVPGVFACGFCQAPQDIPDSVIQSSGVAARVAELLRGEEVLS
jgi:heterodisulfide reductase subunit A